jgi:hypothetical protein
MTHLVNKRRIRIVTCVTILISFLQTAAFSGADSVGKFSFDEPVAIAARSGLVWVSNLDGNSVTEISGSDGHVVRIIKDKSFGLNGPDSIAASSSDVWITNTNTVTELNSRNGSLVRIISGKKFDFNVPESVTLNGSQVWVLNVGGDSITELNAVDGSLVRVIKAHAGKISGTQTNGPNDMLIVGSHLWTSNISPHGNSLVEFQVPDGTIEKVIKLKSSGSNLSGIIAGNRNGMWVTNLTANGDSVSEFDVDSGTLLRVDDGARFRFNSPDGLAVTGSKIWVSNYGNDSVTELNSKNGTLLRVIHSKADGFQSPGPMALGNGHVWVLNTLGQSLTELSATSGSLIRVVR